MTAPKRSSGDSLMLAVGMIRTASRALLPLGEPGEQSADDYRVVLDARSTLDEAAELIEAEAVR